jgi:hypothetical protein
VIEQRRKPGFVDGPAVGLGDGGEWTFPRLELTLRHRVRYAPEAAGGLVACRSAVPTAELPRLGEWVAAITSPPGSIAGDRYWAARMDAAATLLRLNYDLADDELGALLVWESDDPASHSRWDAIDAAVLGTGGPKA